MCVCVKIGGGDEENYLDIVTLFITQAWNIS